MYIIIRIWLKINIYCFIMQLRGLYLILLLFFSQLFGGYKNGRAE